MALWCNNLLWHFVAMHCNMDINMHIFDISNFNNYNKQQDEGKHTTYKLFFGAPSICKFLHCCFTCTHKYNIIHFQEPFKNMKTKLTKQKEEESNQHKCKLLNQKFILKNQYNQIWEHIEVMVFIKTKKGWPLICIGQSWFIWSIQNNYNKVEKDFYKCNVCKSLPTH